MTKKYASGSGGGGGVSNAKDSLFSGDAIEVILGIAEGPIEGIKGATVAEQLHHVYLDGTSVLSQTGTKNFLDSQIILSYERGTPVTIDEDTEFGQTPIPFILGGNATPVNVGVSLDYNIPVSRTVPSGYRNQYNKLEIRLLVSRHVEFTNDGSKPLRTTVVIRYKKSSSTTWTTKYHTIQGKTVSGGYISSYDLYLADTSEDYDLEVVMKNVNDPEKEARDIAWLAYELSNPLKDSHGNTRREMHPGTAMVSFVAKVGENFSNLPNFTAVWRGLLCAIPSNYDPETRTYDETTPWDGSFKAGKYWTNNPFWLARELILNPRFGMARYNPSVSVDDYSLYEEAKYADTSRVTPDGRTIPLFTFNGLITQPMQGLELINYILGSANAQALEYASGHIRVVSDRNTAAVMTVVPEMCVQLQDDVVFTYSATDLKDRFNEVNVSYIEPKMDWQPQFIGPFIDSAAQEIQGVNVYEFEALGCTEVAESEYKAYFKLISAQTETVTITFNIPGYAMDWDIFDIIDIVDPTMDWGLSGRALSVSGNSVMLRDPLYFEETGTYEFHLQTEDNAKVIRSFTIETPGSYQNLTLDLAVLEPLAQYPAFSVMREGANPGRAKPFRVVSIRPVDGGQNIFSVTGIEVNRNKWQQAMDLQVGEKPYYNFEKPRRPATPTNLRFVSSLVVPRNGQSQNLVGLTWDVVEGNFLGLTYTLQVSKDGAPFVDVGDTRLNFYEAEVESNTSYVFRIRLNYNDIQLFSNVIDYNIPEYEGVDFDLARLTFDVTGSYVGDDIKLRVTAMYKYPDTEQVVDLITSGKVKGVVVDFYTREGDTFAFLLSKISSERDIILSAQEQYSKNDTLGSEVRCEVRLIDHNDNLFPSAAVNASINVYALPVVTGIVTTSTSRTISAEVVSTHTIKRNGGVKWFLSETAGGADRKLIAESAGLYAYTVNKPGADFYLWAQPWSNYGVGAIYPAGQGVKVTTQPLQDFESPEPTLEEIQALLSQQINESYLAATLRARIDLIDLSNNGGLVAAQQQLSTALTDADTRLKAADAALQVNINAIDTALTNADTRLKAADTTLQQNINAVNTALTSADTRLKAADTTLQQNINAVNTALTSADTRLKAADSALNLALSDAKLLLQDQIDSQGVTLVSLQNVDAQQAQNLNALTLRLDDTESTVLQLDSISTDHASRLVSIETVNTTQGSSISSLQTTTSSHATSISRLGAYDTAAGKYAFIKTLEQVDAGQASRLGTLEAADTSNKSRITAVESVNATQASKLTALETDNGTNKSKISTLETTTSGHASRLTSVESVNSTQGSKISTLESTTAGQATRLSTLEADNGSSKSRLTSLETADATQASRIEQLSFSLGDSMVVRDLGGLTTNFSTENPGPLTPTATRYMNSTGRFEIVGGGAQFFAVRPFKIDVTRRYRVRFVVQQITEDVGKTRVYAGVRPLNADYGYISDNRYFAATGHMLTIADGRRVFEGDIQGVGGAGVNFPPGTVYVRPMFIVNHSGGTGTAEVESIEIRDVTELSLAESRITSVESVNATQADKLSVLETDNGTNKSKISTLETTTAGHASRLTSIETVNTTQGSNISSLQTTTSSHATSISRLGAYDTAASKYAFIKTLEQADASQVSRIGTLEAADTSNKSRITSVESVNTTQATKISALETDNGTNKSKISTLETTTAGHASRLTSIETVNTTQGSSISSLQTTTGSHATSINRLGAYDSAAGKYAFIKTLEQADASQVSRIGTLEAADTSNKSRITSVESVNATQATKISALETDNGTNKSKISTLETTTSGHASRLTSIETVNTTQGSNISSLQTTTSSHATSISRLGAYDTAAGKYAFIKTLEQADASQVSRIGTLEADNGSSKSRLTSLETADATQASRIEQLSFSQGDGLTVKSLPALSASYNGQVLASVSASSVIYINGNGNISIVGDRRYYSAQAFAVDVNRKYRVRLVVKQLVDSSLPNTMYIYSGVMCLNKDYVSLGNNRYCAVSSAAITVAQGRRVFEGDITLEGTGNGTFIAGTRYVRPMFIVNYQGGTGTAEVESIEIRDITETAAVEDVARAYTDTKTGEIRAERTIKVQADGKVAGIGLIAGATTGSKLIFTAEQIAFVKPGAPAAGAIAPFIYDAASDTTYLNVVFIRDLTAAKIAGGVLNLSEGNIRNLTVFESFNPPDQFLQKAHFSDSLARELAWVDPNAVATGGTLTKTVGVAVATTAIGSFLSGGQAPTVKVSADWQSDAVITNPILGGYIDVQVLRNNVAVTVDGKTTFRIDVSTYLITDEAAPPSQRRYAAHCSGGINGVCAAIANNTNSAWSVRIVTTSGLGAYASIFTVRATIFEAFGSSGGLIANTTWGAISDKPATATRWPTLDEVTGNRAVPLNITHANGLRLVQGNYGAFFRNDGSTFYLMLTNSGDQWGNWNSFRPLMISLATGVCNINGNAATASAVDWANISNKAVMATRWPTWSEVTSKPSTFTPAAHTHAWSDITSGVPATATRWPTLSEVTGRNLADGITGNTVAGRDGSGDIHARLFRSTYSNQSNISGAMAFRINNSSDNYIRFCSDPAAIRAWLGAAAQTSSETITAGLFLGHSQQLRVNDTRAWPLLAPSGYSPSASFEFNTAGAVGVSGGTYVASMVVRPFGTGNDFSGGPAHKLHFSDTGDIFHQTGTNGAWHNNNREVAQYEPNWYFSLRSWLRCATDAGMYWDNGTHVTAAGNGKLNLRGGEQESWIRFQTGGEVTRGYVYADFQNNIGFLNNVGQWSFRVQNDGLCNANDFISLSDRRTKSDLQVISDGLAKLARMTGYTFLRKTSTNGRREAGYIAQDLEAVLPEGVSESEGVKRVSNSATIGLLIQAVNELAAKVARLEGGR